MRLRRDFHANRPRLAPKSMVWPLTPEVHRRWCLRKARANSLRDYLKVPFPKPSSDYREVDYLAIDLETTGLNAKSDHILSVGYVIVHGNLIDLATARHRLVRIAHAIPEASAIIHQITDDQAATGEALETVLTDLLKDMTGKVMIAHHASIERGFLSNACKRIFGSGLPVPIIDTQTVSLRTFQRRQITFKGSDLRLHALGGALQFAPLRRAQCAQRRLGRGRALSRSGRPQGQRKRSRPEGFPVVIRIEKAPIPLRRTKVGYGCGGIGMRYRSAPSFFGR